MCEPIVIVVMKTLLIYYFVQQYSTGGEWMYSAVAGRISTRKMIFVPGSFLLCFSIRLGDCMGVGYKWLGKGVQGISLLILFRDIPIHVSCAVFVRSQFMLFSIEYVFVMRSFLVNGCGRGVILHPLLRMSECEKFP